MLPLPSEIAAGHIVLRRHKIGDLDRFTEFIVHRDTTRYMLIPEDRKTPSAAAEMLQMLIASYDSPTPFYSLSIADGISDAFLGFCQLWPTAEERVFEIVYAVAPDEQGRGNATRAAQALAQHVLENEHAMKIIAYVSPENTPSVRVAEKAGFVCEGPSNHHGRNALKFSITKVAGTTDRQSSQVA
jgi:RimJ/RimL family protein N-acetyltransferase